MVGGRRYEDVCALRDKNSPEGILLDIAGLKPVAWLWCNTKEEQTPDGQLQSLSQQSLSAEVWVILG
jgi:hypothetical protein